MHKIFSPHRGFTSQNCICSLSLIQHESRTITIQYNLCVRAYECMCAHTSFSKGGVQTPPPSHFHYGQISGLCYSSVAFCRRAGSLITHTALLHFHFLFIQPPFHSGFIILPSELSSPVWVFAACWNDIISDLDKCLTVFHRVYNQTRGSGFCSSEGSAAATLDSGITC